MGFADIPRVSVLVTGGAGYIGSHAAKALAAANREPVVFDNLSQGTPSFVRWGPLVEADLNNTAALDSVFERYKPNAVLHFAGRIDATESLSNPGLYWRENLAATLRLIEAMGRHGVIRLVYSSSASVYGASANASTRESAPLRPTTPYGESKAAAERAIRESGIAGLRWIAFRFFNAAGADPEGELGERHLPETHAVPLAIQAALGGKAFSIFGTDYDTPDGTAVRDYVHVSDLAAAHVHALDYLESGGESVPLNLGAQQGTSVRALVAAVAAAAGGPVPTVSAVRRPGDVATLVADCGEARQRGLWAPRLSNIDTVVRSAWRWHCGQRGDERAELPRTTKRTGSPPGP